MLYLIIVVFFSNNTPIAVMPLVQWVGRDPAAGWAGWALAHPEFGVSVNPITTRGADYAHHITASPPGFENPAAALNVDYGL